MITTFVKQKKKKLDTEGKTEEEIKQMEHEQAKEEIHQAELSMGYEQDEKFEESED